MTTGERIEAATEALNEVIISRSKTVVVAFLVMTVVFAGGFGLVSTDTDSTDSFTNDLPEQDALDAVNEEFEGPFEASTNPHSWSTAATTSSRRRNSFGVWRSSNASNSATTSEWRLQTARPR